MPGVGGAGEWVPHSITEKVLPGALHCGAGQVLGGAGPGLGFLQETSGSAWAGVFVLGLERMPWEGGGGGRHQPWSASCASQAPGGWGGLPGISHPDGWGSNWH
jgi:hypothetical protein